MASFYYIHREPSGSVDIFNMTARQLTDRSEVAYMYYSFTVSPIDGSNTRIGVQFDWMEDVYQQQFASKLGTSSGQILNYTIKDVSLSFNCDFVMDRRPLPVFCGEIDPKFKNQFNGIDLKHSLIQKGAFEIDNSIPIHPTHHIDKLVTNIDSLLKYWIYQVENLSESQKNNWVLTLGNKQSIEGDIYFYSEMDPIMKIYLKDKRNYPKLVHSTYRAQTNRLSLRWIPNLENEDERIDTVYLAFWYSPQQWPEHPIEFSARNDSSQLPWLEFHSKDFPEGHATIDLSNIPYYKRMRPIWIIRKGNEFWIEEGDDLKILEGNIVNPIGSNEVYSDIETDIDDDSTIKIVRKRFRDFYSQFNRNCCRSLNPSSTRQPEDHADREAGPSRPRGQI